MTEPPEPLWLVSIPHQKVIRESDGWRCLLKELREKKRYWSKPHPSLDDIEYIIVLKNKYLIEFKHIWPVSKFLIAMVLWDLEHWDPHVPRGKEKIKPPPHHRPSSEDIEKAKEKASRLIDLRRLNP